MPCTPRSSAYVGEAADDLSKLNAFALSLLEANDLEDLLWGIADNVGSTLGFDDCVVYLREGGRLLQMAAFGVKSPLDREIFSRIEIPVGRGIVGTVAETGVAEIVSDTREDPRYIPDEFVGLSELTVPVVYEGEVIAVLDCEAADVGAFTEHDRELFQSIANIAGPRIASAISEQYLREAKEALRIANERLEERVAQRTTELERERERLRVTLRSIGDGVIAVEEDLRIVFVSRAAEHLLGCRREKAVGRSIDDLYVVHAPESEAPVPFLDRCPDPTEAQSASTGLVVHSTCGSHRHISEGISRISGPGADGWVVVFRDVTEQRRVELDLRKAQRLESLGVLAGGIAHDFNNFLTSIMGNLDILRGELTGAEGDEVVEAMDGAWEACMNATGLPRQLVALSRGGAPVKEMGASLEGLIRGAVDFSLAGSNTLGLIDIEKELCRADIDPAQVGQVLNNLLLNAVQATPHGGRVFVAARNARSDSGERWILITVRDEGPGIPEENLERIFDPFFTTKEEGSGLGLASTHSVVRRHGGHLVVKSTLGEGATFEVWLPASAETEAVDSDPAEESDYDSHRILAMDDDVAILRLLSMALRRYGYAVTCVEAADAAVEECRRALEDDRPYDLAVLDVTLPGGGGGAAALSRLREIQPALRAVVTSGYAENSDMECYRERGFQGALPKPFPLDALLEVVETALAIRPATPPLTPTPVR